MKTVEAIQHFGTQKSLCTALGIGTRQTIHAWGEYPPVGRQYQLEVITNGKLRAERVSTVLDSTIAVKSKVSSREVRELVSENEKSAA